MQTRYRAAVASREDWKRRLGPLFGGAVALTTSSSLPWPALRAEDEPPAAGWLIAVGGALGLMAYAIAALALRLGLPVAGATSLALVAAVLLGGAVVERGVATYLTHAVDSALGHTAVAGSLLLRAELLAAIAPEHWLWAFPTVWVIGRWSATFLQAIGDPVLDPPPRSLVSAPPPAWMMGVATAVVAIAAVSALGWRMLLALALAAALSFALGLVAQRRRGGIDAAVIGAAALTGELIALLVLAAR
jgi:cobalamin synthase